MGGSLPDAAVETHLTAVQVQGAVIAGQPVAGAVQGEGAARDTVGDAARGGAEV